MNKSKWNLFLLSVFFVNGIFVACLSNAEETAVLMDPVVAQKEGDIPAATLSEKSKEEILTENTVQSTKSVRPAKRTDRADAFLAGPDWPFDGFVAGGQDSNVRSMFYLNDLVYINIGAQHGIGVGDKLGIYKRGDRVRDPQTGKFIGYEVRRAAIARASDRVEDEVAAVRITSTYEAVEIGDLVRREQ